MEYGTGFLRTTRTTDDDTVSMLSATNQPSPHHAYSPEHSRESSASSIADRSSWAVSPVALQQALPPAPPEQESSGGIGASIFGSRAVLDTPYQETVAFGAARQSRSARPDSPKPEAQATVSAVPESDPPPQSRRYFRHPRHILEPWTSGFWIRFPWLGFGALLGVILLTGVSAGILLASHGTAVEDWRVGDDNAQPQVYISLSEMIMNFLIIFTLMDGMTVRFWRQLIHGSTLSAIYDTYDSVSFWPAFMRMIRLRFNVVTVACILAAVSAIRGPLFQRSLTVWSSEYANTTASINVKMAPFPLIEYFQKTDPDPWKQGGVTTAFSNVLRQLNSGTGLPYKQSPSECGEYCTGDVKGFGFKVNCTSSTRPFDLTSLPEECRSCFTRECQSSCDFRRRYSFSPNFFHIGYHTNVASVSAVQDQALILTSVFKNDTSCKGFVHVHTCSLYQVITKYPIAITNGTIDRLPNDLNPGEYENSMPLNKTLMGKYWPLAFKSLFPLVAVNVTATEDFSRLQCSKCVIPFNEETTDGSVTALTQCSNGTTLNSPLLTNDASVFYATPTQTPAGQDPLCGLTWRDPMQDMIDKMQSLAFRITVDMAITDGSVFSPSFVGKAVENLRKNWIQEVSVSGYRTETIYKINPILVALAVLISLVGVIAILPLYMGFWELGRKVSLNPLEIARAFGAPLMEGIDGNATSERVVIERGGMAVRYGALERFGEEKKLRIEETSRAAVRVPWQGEIFG